MAKLGQLLAARGWISVQQLTRALQNQTVVGGRLGTCLLEMDSLSEETLLEALSEQLGVPAATLDELRGIPDEVLALIPEKLARRCRTVPFRVAGGRLDVAMMDPRNLSAQDEIAFASGKRVKVHIAHEIRLFEALEKYYHEESPSRFGMLLDRLNRQRFLWQPAAKAAAAREPETGEFGLYGPTPKLVAAPSLPEIPLPPISAPAPAMRPRPPAAPPPPVAAPQAPPAFRPAAGPAVASAPAAALRPAPAVGSAAAVRPVPAAPPPRPSSVALTPEERNALGMGSARKKEAAPQAPPPETFQQVVAAFEATHDREEVARILLEFLSLTYRRSALFQVARDRVSGWMASGEGIHTDLFHQFSVGFDQPSLFLNLRQGNGLYLGPLPPMPAHRQLARSWGGELPRDCVMLPVRIKDRLVTVVYADGATRGLGGFDLSQLQRLTAATAAAFERCILHKKRGESRP